MGSGERRVEWRGETLSRAARLFAPARESFCLSRPTTSRTGGRRSRVASAWNAASRVRSREFSVEVKRPPLQGYRRRVAVVVATLALRKREKERRCLGDTRSFRKNRPTSVSVSKDSCNARFKCARANQVQRSEKKIDGEAEWLSSVYSHRARGVSRGRTPMVFENIEMRNPTGFLLEDARHGYIQYIRYVPLLVIARWSCHRSCTRV